MKRRNPPHLARSTLVLQDHGPAFHGWVGRLSSGAGLCVAPPRILTNPVARAVMRELVTRQGGDCARCANCVIGKELLTAPAGTDDMEATEGNTPSKTVRKTPRVSKAGFLAKQVYRRHRD